MIDQQAHEAHLQSISPQRANQDSGASEARNQAQRAQQAEFFDAFAFSRQIQAAKTVEQGVEKATEWLAKHRPPIGPIQEIDRGEAIVLARKERRKQRRAHPKRGVRCQICHRRANTKEELANHFASAHNIKPDGQQIGCRLCGVKLNSLAQEKEHKLGKTHREKVAKERAKRAASRSRRQNN